MSNSRLPWTTRTARSRSRARTPQQTLCTPVRRRPVFQGDPPTRPGCSGVRTAEPECVRAWQSAQRRHRPKRNPCTLVPRDCTLVFTLEIDPPTNAVMRFFVRFAVAIASLTKLTVSRLAITGSWNLPAACMLRTMKAASGEIKLRTRRR